MADEVASLKVKISADADGVEETIKGVSAELSTLSKQAEKSAESLGKETDATKQNTAEKEKSSKASAEAAEAIGRENQALTKSCEGLKSDTAETKKNALSKREQSRYWRELGEGINTVSKPLQLGSVALAAGGVAATKFAMNYETAFTGVRKTVDGTETELAELSDGLRKLALTIPVSAEELANLAAVGGQLGVPVDKIEKFTETIAALGVATNLSGAEGASALARIINVTGEDMDNVDKIGSAIVALGNNFATTESEIADMTQRLGKFGNTVGMDAEAVLGYAAALSSMGIAADAGGSSLGRIWLDMEMAAQKGGAALETYAEYAKTTAESFRKAWQENASEAFRAVVQGLKETENLTVALENLGINDVRQVQSMMALVNGYDTLTRSLELSKEAYLENNALNKEASAAYATTANQVQLAKNSLVEMGISVGNLLLPTVSNVANGVGNLAEHLANMDETSKASLVTIGEGVVLLGAFSKIAGSAAKGIGSYYDAVDKLQKVTENGGGIASSLASALLRVTAVTNTLGVAALAATGIGLALYGVVAAVDAWKNSQRRWTKGLSEGNDAIRENIGALEDLEDAEKRARDAREILENPDADTESTEKAKADLREIAEYCNQTYGVHIDADAENLDDTLKKLKEVQEYRTKNEILQQTEKLQDLRPKYEESKVKIPNLKKQLEEEEKEAEHYLDILLDIQTVKEKYKTGSQEYLDAFAGLNEKYGIDFLAPGAIGNIKWLKETADMRAEELTENIKNLQGGYDEYRAISEEIANWQTELLRRAAGDGDADGVQQALAGIGEMVRNADLDLRGYAEATALAMNGVASLEQAWKEAANGDSTALDGIVADYLRASREFGASAQQSAVGAALIQSGFRSIEEADAAGKLEQVTERANELKGELEGFPENTTIQIDAQGNLSLLDEASGRIKEIENADGLRVRIDAEGNLETLNQFGDRISYLEDVGAVSLRINAETGGIEALNEAGDIVAELGEIETEGIEIAVHAEAEDAKAVIQDLNNEPVTVNVDALTEDAEEKIGALNGKTVRVKLVTAATAEARGTADFSGGLAMINDERGVSDPRELVEIGGRGYLFEGRDVILPLPEHAKVFTASQTRQIMRGYGIAHYASGKNNEAWESDKAGWQHKTKTSLIPIAASEYLAWIETMRERYAYDLEVMEELDELFADATKDHWEEWLETLEEQLDDGEIAFAEFYEQVQAYRDENIPKEAEAYQAYTESMEHAAREMYEDRKEASYDWLEHEERYNKLSADDYIAGLKRIEAYTEEYYAQGLISYEKYAESIADINDEIWEKQEEKAEAWRADADFYFRQSEVFGWDWLHEDSPLEYWNRVLEQEQKIAADTDLSLNDRQTALRKADEARLEIYQAKNEELEDAMQSYREEIDKMREELDEKVQKLRDSWEVEDRKTDMTELQRQMKLYENAVTKEGKEKYRSLSEEYTRLEREEQIYQMEQENEAYLAAMEDTYAKMETEKEETMQRLRDELTAGFRDSLSAAERMEWKLESSGNGIVSELEEGNQWSKTETEAIERVKQAVGAAMETGNEIAKTTSGYVESIRAEHFSAVEAMMEKMVDMMRTMQETPRGSDVNVAQTNYFTVQDRVDAESIASRIAYRFQSQYGGR